MPMMPASGPIFDVCGRPVPAPWCAPPASRVIEAVILPNPDLNGASGCEDTPIEVTAKGGRIHIRNSRFEGACDRLSYDDSCDQVVLKGKVRLKIHNSAGADDKISAERVEIGLHEDYFSVTPCSSNSSQLKTEKPTSCPSEACKPTGTIPSCPAPCCPFWIGHFR